MTIATVGIIGLGTMGRGIAGVCLAAGYRVVVFDTNPIALARETDRLINKARSSSTTTNFITDNLKQAAGIPSFNICQLIIEAIQENLNSKQQLLAELDEICPPQTILATNTSSLLVKEIGALAKRPGRIIGLHFFNPADRMKLVEIIAGQYTKTDIIENARRFVQSLGKVAICAPDVPGFIVNRILLAVIREAIELYRLGASRHEIDLAVELGLNHPVGPFRLIEFIGLQTIRDLARSLTNSTTTPPRSLILDLENILSDDTKKIVNSGPF